MNFIEKPVSIKTDLQDMLNSVLHERAAIKKCTKQPQQTLAIHCLFPTLKHGGESVMMWRQEYLGNFPVQ